MMDCMAIHPLFSFSPDIFLFSEEKRKRLLTRLGYPRTRRFSERKSPSAWNDIVIPRSAQKFPSEISVSAGNCKAIPCREQILQSKICEGNGFASKRNLGQIPLSAQIS